MTMIEKVARAIAVSEGHFEVEWANYEDAARAAIEAMRDIDDELLDKGSYDLDMTLRNQWENIIDAALEEK